MSGGVALALSGGAVRGAAHIGVLEALEDEGLPVTAIAGTSAGSMVGALYAAGMPLKEMRRLALETSWKTLLQPTFPRRGLVSSEGIYRFMKEVLPVSGFSSLRLPFAAVATDLRTGEKVSITAGSLARAVQASCSLPVVFTPTVIRGKDLIDGGVASMVPVKTAREELGASTVIAVDVNYRSRTDERPGNLMSIAVQVTALWAGRNAREEMEFADAAIRVSASGIALYDVTKTAELLRRGRRAAAEKMGEIKRAARW